MGSSFYAAKHSNIDRLVEMRREFCQHEEIGFNERRARAALGQLLDAPSLGQVWLIENDGQVVGYVVLTLGYSLEFDGREAYVDEIYCTRAIPWAWPRIAYATVCRSSM
jgi:hypothetical protein